MREVLNRYHLKTWLLLSAVLMCFVISGKVFSLTASAAVVIEPGDTIEGTIDERSTKDTYVFKTGRNTLSYAIACDADAGMDFIVTVYNSRGIELARQDSWESYDGDYDCLWVRALKPGRKYYIVVETDNVDVNWGNYQLFIMKSNEGGSVKLSKTSSIYTGKKQKLPTVTVYDCKGRKISKKDYTYWFNDYDNKEKYVKEIGQYSVYVLYGSDYYHYMAESECGFADCHEGDFVIRPPRVKITDISSKSGNISITCQKSKYAECYHYMVATDKKFKNIVKSSSHSKTNKKTFSGLEKGKTYYVRVCIDGGDFIYSNYSPVKKIKCK